MEEGNGLTGCLCGICTTCFPTSTSNGSGSCWFVLVFIVQWNEYKVANQQHPLPPLTSQSLLALGY